MAPVCKFYQSGTCRNGANCRFEHPGASSNPFGTANTNRFGPLSSGGGGGGTKDPLSQYKITKESIKIDLAEERPEWIFSSYGPGKEAPEQLFGGYPREQSFEEVRLFFEGTANRQEADQQLQALYQTSEQEIKSVLNNIDGALQFIVQGENKHPNRNDICKQNTREGGTNGTFAVGRSSNGFSNPLNSTPATNQNPFATTAQASPFGAASTTPAANPFGAPATTAPTSAFGQVSSIGQKPNSFGSVSAFGQPSQLGATGGSAFGQPSQLGGTTSAFGQASALGAKPNPFGSAPSGPSGFAQAAQQPSSFAPAAAQQPSVFGQRLAMGLTQNVFGTPPAAANPFGQPAAGQNAAPPTNPFGQPAQSQSATPLANPFGQPAQTQNAAPLTNPFGQPAQANAGFGRPAAAANPFAAAASSAPDQSMDTAAAPAASASPFAQPASIGSVAPETNSFALSQVQANPLGQAQVPAAATPAKGTPGNPYPPNSTKQHPPITSYSSRDISGRITMFKGRPVVYNNEGKPGIRMPDRSWKKIWFPDGAPGYYRDTEPAEPAKYDENVRAAYEAMSRTGRFEGDMPEVPPMREDCVWNF